MYVNCSFYAFVLCKYMKIFVFGMVKIYNLYDM
jgi:hypothetical protein